MRLIVVVLATAGCALAVCSEAVAAAPECTGLIRGTSASERLVVSAAATHVLGLEGDDDITGSRGRDCLEGGPGRDHLAGRGAADVLVGGPGSDRLAGGSGADRITDAPAAYAFGLLASGSNHVSGGPGGDVVDVANARRDIVRCGPGRDRVTVDKGDRLFGCERRKVLASPLPAASPARGGRAETFIVRFRAIQEVAANGEFFSIAVEGPPGCGKIETSSLGIRYRARRRRALPPEAFRRRREGCEALVSRPVPRHRQLRAGARVGMRPDRRLHDGPACRRLFVSREVTQKPGRARSWDDWTRCGRKRPAAAPATCGRPERRPSSARGAGGPR